MGKPHIYFQMATTFENRKIVSNSGIRDENIVFVSIQKRNKDSSRVKKELVIYIICNIIIFLT